MRYPSCSVLLGFAVLPWLVKCDTVQWTWNCKDERCIREPSNTNANDQQQALETCRLICGKYRTLWPAPTGITELGKSLVTFKNTSLKIDYSASNNLEVQILLYKAIERFKEQLHEMYNSANEERARNMNGFDQQPQKQDFEETYDVSMQITVDGGFDFLDLDTDESYQISFEKINNRQRMFLLARTYFGARHGLESMLRLFGTRDMGFGIYFQTLGHVRIFDRPIYPHRGIMIDTSRTYFSMDSLKKIIDGMALNKLNVLHWHMTDSNSFPFHSKRAPKMTLFGSYNPGDVYYAIDIHDLVEYGLERGVKIIPEIDTPSHSGNGWQWGPGEGLGELAVCVNEEPWAKLCASPPCGQLNPVNDNVYDVLEQIYADILEVLDAEMFHMGGDEIYFSCWNKTSEIVTWLESKGWDRSDESFLRLWGEVFQKKARERLIKANKGKDIPSILWTSELTTGENIGKYLNTDDYIIQIWTAANNTMIGDILKKGYRVIFSNYDAWYLDCGFSNWFSDQSNWCSPYKTWKDVYENRPRDIVVRQTREQADQLQNLVIGGEAALWTEQVDEQTFEGRLWPRAAALAERLWSDPDTGWQESADRMAEQRRYMVSRGFKAEALQPEWCALDKGGYCI